MSLLGEPVRNFITLSQVLRTIERMSEQRDSYTLFTATGCHWCERARQMLTTLGVTYREADIYGDEAAVLAGRGVVFAFPPVLVDGLRVIAYGRFSEGRLREELGR